MTHSPAAPGDEIVIPGSISNLGPAFDALSVAVDVYLRVRIDQIGEPSSLPAFDPESGVPGGPVSDLVIGGQVPASGENRVSTGFFRAAATFGELPPAVRVHVTSDIPMRAGLGSSAAATVAGLRLYEALTSPRDPETLMEIATAIEGHPDNAAAALLGGLTLSCQRDDGRVVTSAWRWPDDLRFVVATPDVELETAFARKVLAPEIDRRDAIFNLQRALLLVRALDDGRYDHLREALRDRWHQPARASHVPGLTEALALDHPSVLGVCLSGAGPSVAVLAIDPETAANELRHIYGALGVPCTIRVLAARPPFASSSSTGTHP